MPDCCTGLCSATFFMGVISTGLVIAGLGTPYWLKDGDNHVGLWADCVPGCDSYYNITDDPDWLNGVRSCMVLPALGFLIVCLFYTCFCCCNRCGRNFMITMQVIFLWLAAASAISGVVVFDHHYKEFDTTGAYSQYDWSFYLSCAGGGLFVLAGLSGLIEICTAE